MNEELVYILRVINMIEPDERLEVLAQRWEEGLQSERDFPITTVYLARFHHLLE